jgi:rhodanese-related sulfurtransferase
MRNYNVLRLNDLVEMLDQEPRPFLLDVREVSEVEAGGYIPGAVLIPLRDLTRHLDMLPAFDQPVVAYCGSGWRCTIAMTALGMLGWRQALSLQDGSFSGYLAAGYPVSSGVPTPGPVLDAARPDPEVLRAVDDMLQGLPSGWGAISVEDLADELAGSEAPILLDVRAQDEIDPEGFIEAENAVSIPVEELVARRAEWPRERETLIVAYSGSGYRGGLAMTILRTYGYSNAMGLHGGADAWAQAGYPLVQGASP